jgi:hypothetical protein
MKELLDTIKRIEFIDVNNIPLYDTCFFISTLEHQHHLDKPFLLTSFNAEELVHVSHRLHENLKHSIRKFLHNPPSSFAILDLPIHPGNRDHEREFVASVEPELLKKVPDPSDAVLIAAAIKAHTNVFTRDKHHLYTVVLENFLQRYGIVVANKHE